MKIKINKNAFAKGLATVSPVISSKNIGIKTCILLDAKEDKLVLTATDGQITIRHTIENTDDKTFYTCEDTGVSAVPGSLFTDAVKATNADELDIFTEGNCLIIKAGRGKMAINCFNADDYPNINFPENGAVITMKHEELASIIEKTVFATSTNLGRPILTGVNFKMENGSLTCVGTDSFRLSKIVELVPFCDDIKVTIPASTLAIAKKIFNQPGADVNLMLTERRALFTDNNTIINSPLLDGGFPEVDHLIPTTSKTTLVIHDRPALMNVLTRGMIIKNDNLPIFRMDMTVEDTMLSNRNQETGQFVEHLDNVEFSGEPLTLSFDGKYLLDALKVFTDNEVMISFNGDTKPIVITSEHDAGVLELMLPTKVYY